MVLLELCSGIVCVDTVLICSLRKIKINEQELKTRQLKVPNERWQNNEVRKRPLIRKITKRWFDRQVRSFKLQNTIILRLAGSFKVYKSVDSNFRMKHYIVCATNQILRMRK